MFKLKSLKDISFIAKRTHLFGCVILFVLTSFGFLHSEVKASVVDTEMSRGRFKLISSFNEQTLVAPGAFFIEVDALTQSVLSDDYSAVEFNDEMAIAPEKVDFRISGESVNMMRDDSLSAWISNLEAGDYKVCAIVTDSLGGLHSTDTIKFTVHEKFPDHYVKIKVHFDRSLRNVKVEKAALKYDKHFAYSFTLDDTFKDAYTYAFPLFKGGLAGDGVVYPGLKYTDGCGNDHNFKCGISWVARMGNPIGDPHVNSSSLINWNELIELIKEGWNVFNHTYTHADYTNSSVIDYKGEIEKNYKEVLDRTGYPMLHMVLPTGDGDYVEPAFNSGITSITSSKYKYYGHLTGVRVNSDEPLDYSRFKMTRRLLHNGLFKDETFDAHRFIDDIAAKCNDDNHFWFNDFTHSVGEKESSASLQFSYFKKYIKEVEEKYGKSGSDVIWMAPVQDVFEYIQTRNSTHIMTSVSDNMLTIGIDTMFVPNRMVSRSLSLIIHANEAEITELGNVSDDFRVSFSARNTESAKKLVNLDWDGLFAQKSLKTGIQNVSRGNESFKVFNSANVYDYLNFEIDQVSDEFNLRIFNTNGLSVISEKLVSNSANRYHIPVQNLKTGIYLISLTSNSGYTYNSKFIIR